MKDTYKYIFLILIFVLFQFCGEKPSSSTTTTAEEPTKKQTVTKAPKLSAVYESFDDLAYLFQHQNDTTYVINFWATWCAPCIAELPYFEEVNKVYKEEKVKVVLVSLDSKKHIDTKLRPFIQKEKLMSEVIALTDIDYNTWIDKVHSDWDGAIPATIVYNQEELEFIGGEFENYQELNSIVKSYLKH